MIAWILKVSHTNKTLKGYLLKVKVICIHGGVATSHLTPLGCGNWSPDSIGAWPLVTWTLLLIFSTTSLQHATAWLVLSLSELFYYSKPNSIFVAKANDASFFDAQCTGEWVIMECESGLICSYIIEDQCRLLFVWEHAESRTFCVKQSSIQEHCTYHAEGIQSRE